MTLERALAHLDAFLERAHPGYAHDVALHREARALSEAYTTGKPFSADAAASAAYLAHFGPRAVVATWHAATSTPVPAECVDAGAGSGASALALAFAGARRVTLVERSAPSLAWAQRLLQDVCAVRPIQKHVEEAEARDAELVLSSFSFGELAGTPREAFAQLARLAPRARTTVIVDAGDRARARRVQQLRDTLVLEGRGIVAPCPHRDPCPALVRERDWCHDRWPKDLPPRLAQFALAVGRDADWMSAAWLVVGDAPTLPPSLLVIGEAHKEKGRARIPICGPSGLRFLQALKRDRAAHDAVLALPRGARLRKVPTELCRDNTAYIAHVSMLAVTERHIDAPSATGVASGAATPLAGPRSGTESSS